jgi:hypothetical protein
MRLTLRTLLAYIDNILEPADAKEIESKVSESEFATNLMHRMRDVTRRLRLGAPKLEGRGMALDPNTVAEYLDNTLASERVPEFEKICLESDMHLAEVASAHQILTLVLGEPAEINTPLRERMYALGSTVAQPTPKPSDTPVPSRTPAPSTSSPVAATVTPPPLASVELPSKSKPEIPDYLREPPMPRRSRGRLVAALLMMALVGAGVVAAINYPQLLDKLNSTQTVQTPTPHDEKPVAKAPVEKAAPPETKNATGEPTAATPSVELQQPPGVNPSPPPATVATPAGQPPLPPDRVVAPAATPSVITNSVPLMPAVPGPTVPPAPAPAPGGTVATTPDVASQSPVAMPAPTSAPVSGTTTSATSVPAGPTMTGPAVSNPAVPTPMPPGTGGPATTTTSPSVPAVAPPPPTEVGRFMEGELLLRFTPNDNLWHRVPMRSTVMSSDRFMSLPTYRNALTLASGMNVDLLGGTDVIVGAMDAQGVPGIEVLDGRLMLLSAGAPTAAAGLSAAGRRGVLVLSDANSSVAFEVRHHHAEGANPEKEPSAVEVELFVTTGKVAWTDSNAAQPEVISAPARRMLVGGPPMPAGAEVASFPTWVTVSDERRQSQKLAAAELSKALPTDRPVTLGLKELADDRKVETSLLAIQCLAQVGDFDTLVTALKDPNQKANWNDEIEALRDAIARSQLSAAAVRGAFERRYGPRGIELYRMLWGYTPDQINAGAGTQLVKSLDHEDLEYRVLAFAALVRLSNGATLFYRPEFPAARRQQYIAKWKQRLDSGQLVPKSSSTP